MAIDNVAESIKKQLKDDDKVKVRVALFGQPGAGKSSLINKIVGAKVAEVGVETDKTVEAASYESKGLIFVDLPGYGTKNFPKEDYFDRFRINEFDLFLCVTSGKLHQADTEFFRALKNRKKVCIFVVNKHDELWEEGVSTKTLEQRKLADIRKHVEDDVLVNFTSCRTDKGLGELNESIHRNLDGAKKERWARGAKAYSEKFLAEKKKACEKYVALASVASAANALNPIPGVDVGVDMSILVKLFAEIRSDFSLNDTFLASLKQSTIPMVAQLANNVLRYATKEGLVLLLKRFAGRQAVKMFSKYIPGAGQALSAGIGYAITSNAGSSYLNECHDLAQEALANHLGY